MKAVLSLILPLLAVFFSGTPQAAESPMGGPGMMVDMALTVKLPRKTYSRSNEIGAEITLTNRSSQTVFVRRFAGWGESSSVSVWIHDLAGNSVNSDFLADELDPPVTSAGDVEELRPGMSKRFVLNIPLAEYDLKRGGSYRLTVVYHSSISPTTKLPLPLLVAGHPRISSSSIFAVK